MAKNFTDFQPITGKWESAALQEPDLSIPHLTGTTVTDATTGMHLVGYDVQEPHGERRFTIESVLLAADKYHVGLENVDNESKTYMFDNSVLTGYTSAEDLYIHGNLHVEGTEVILNTDTYTTSAMDILNSGTKVALTVTQVGANDVARFMYGSEPALVINNGGYVGIGLEGTNAASLLLGAVPGGHGGYGTSLSAAGNIELYGFVDGRDVNADGNKLDTIEWDADVTSIALSSVSSRLAVLSNLNRYSGIEVKKGFDLLEEGDDFKKLPTLSASDLKFSKEKLVSIEDEADVTGDHSADITYNHVPDGPWTGALSSTYVKVTSGDQERLTAVRGVENGLYQSGVDGGGVSYTADDGGDIDRFDIERAYQQAHADYWSSENEFEYRGTIIPTVTAAVQNINGEGLADGHADLSHLSVSTSLSANGEVYLGSPTHVLSGGAWKPGINLDVNAGGTWLRFVDGLLVDSKPGTGNGGNNNPF